MKTGEFSEDHVMSVKKEAQNYIESIYPIFQELAFVQVPTLLSNAGILTDVNGRSGDFTMGDYSGFGGNRLAP